MTAHFFAPEVVAAVLHHMNDDHIDDNLVIVRAFADKDAEAAIMVGLDGDGGVWNVTVAGTQSEARIPWSQPITERPEIRREVVVLYDAACEVLGLPRREH